MCYFSVLDQKKIQNLIREGEKKTFRKKNIEPIFGKVNEATKEKNIGQISRKVNEGGQIKKIFDLFFKS